jgi:hypothetical protein
MASVRKRHKWAHCRDHSFRVCSRHTSRITLAQSSQRQALHTDHCADPLRLYLAVLGQYTRVRERAVVLQQTVSPSSGTPLSAITEAKSMP